MLAIGVVVRFEDCLCYVCCRLLRGVAVYFVFGGLGGFWCACVLVSVGVCFVV